MFSLILLLLLKFGVGTNNILPWNRSMLWDGHKMAPRLKGAAPIAEQLKEKQKIVS